MIQVPARYAAALASMRLLYMASELRESTHSVYSLALADS